MSSYITILSEVDINFSVAFDLKVRNLSCEIRPTTAYHCLVDSVPFTLVVFDEKKATPYCDIRECVPALSPVLGKGGLDIISSDGIDTQLDLRNIDEIDDTWAFKIYKDNMSVEYSEQGSVICYHVNSGHLISFFRGFLEFVETEKKPMLTFTKGVSLGEGQAISLNQSAYVEPRLTVLMGISDKPVQGLCEGYWFNNNRVQLCVSADYENKVQEESAKSNNHDEYKFPPCIYFKDLLKDIVIMPLNDAYATVYINEQYFCVDKIYVTSSPTIYFLVELNEGQSKLFLQTI